MMVTSSSRVWHSTWTDVEITVVHNALVFLFFVTIFKVIVWCIDLYLGLESTGFDGWTLLSDWPLDELTRLLRIERLLLAVARHLSLGLALSVG